MKTTAALALLGALLFASNAHWQLVLTFNEWPEGTSAPMSGRLEGFAP